MENMERNLTENNSSRPPKIDDIIEGKIINKGKSSVFLDLGPWGTGIIYGREFQAAKDTLKDLEIGDNIFAKIIDLENEEGYIELSISQAGRELSWEKLKNIKEREESITVRISGVNRGGLLTEISGISAFLPLSQLSPANYPKIEGADASKILKALQKFIGKEMEVKIFDLDSNEEKLILSEKAKEAKRVKEILKNYKVGDVIEGKITGIVDFGAFIRFPILPEWNQEKGPESLDGLIHISELDWQLIADPSSVVKVGQIVKAKIIEITDDGRISLSLKALKKDPWKDIAKVYKKGDIVKGRITKLNPFGAFVQLTPKIQGLCHISEFSSRAKMEDLLKVDGEYEFQILLIDPEEHRINLKLV